MPRACWHVQLLSSRIESSSCQIRGPLHSNSSLSLLSGIYRLFSLAETTNSTFLCRLWRNWITPSTRTGCQKAGSTCCPPVRVGRPITGLVQWSHAQRLLCYLHMPIHITDDCFTHKLRHPVHTHINQPAIPPTPELLLIHTLISQSAEEIVPAKQHKLRPTNGPEARMTHRMYLLKQGTNTLVFNRCYKSICKTCILFSIYVWSFKTLSFFCNCPCLWMTEECALYKYITFFLKTPALLRIMEACKQRHHLP